MQVSRLAANMGILVLAVLASRAAVLQAGQYILLGWKGEWHPFTLTSAPEDTAEVLQ